MNESELRRMIFKSVKRTINESLSQAHEDRLRQQMKEYASQIRNILEKMTMVGHTGNNFMNDLLQKEYSSIVDKLYDAYFEMQEFAKTTDQRRQEEEDSAAMPDGGWEHFGY